jgi:DNA replication protein DnaC
MSTSFELTHLFRALKAPAAARALPKLDDRARAEEWSYERFAQARFQPSTPAARHTEARAASRPRASPPERRSRSSTSRSSARSSALIQHLGQLDFIDGKENAVLLGPPGTGKTHLSIAIGIRACLAGHRVAFRTATEWVALLGDAQRHGRLDTELDRLQRIPLLIVDEAGYIPFDRRPPTSCSCSCRAATSAPR